MIPLLGGEGGFIFSFEAKRGCRFKNKTQTCGFDSCCQQETYQTEFCCIVK